jgi:hypothetical protein
VCLVQNCAILNLRRGNATWAMQRRPFRTHNIALSAVFLPAHSDCTTVVHRRTLLRWYAALPSACECPTSRFQGAAVGFSAVPVYSLRRAQRETRVCGRKTCRVEFVRRLRIDALRAAATACTIHSVLRKEKLIGPRVLGLCSRGICTRQSRTAARRQAPAAHAAWAD